MYSDAELRAQGFAVAQAGNDSLDAIMLNTAHNDFARPDFAAWRTSGVLAVLDGRNALSRADVEAAGLRYLAVGDGRATIA